MASGLVLPFAGSAAPRGWLLCHGQAVSRTTYAALFDAIGTAFGGGDGTTTFNLPDLRGRVPAGVDNMGGTAANRLTTAGSGVDGALRGAAGGSQSEALTETQMPAHNHSGSAVSNGNHAHAVYGSTATTGTGVGGGRMTVARGFAGYTQTEGLAYFGSFDASNVQALQTDGAHTHSLTINNAGSGSAHNNTQPTVVLNYLIKT